MIAVTMKTFTRTALSQPVPPTTARFAEELPEDLVILPQEHVTAWQGTKVGIVH